MSRDGDDRDYLLALQLQWDINKEERASVERAAREQQQYDMEDRQLVSEREALAAALPDIFECGICLDEHPEDSVARIVHCRHQFCRTCLREYIRNKLSEHIYPIFCPSCVAEQGTSEPTCAFYLLSNTHAHLYLLLQLSLKILFANSGLRRKNTAFFMNYKFRRTLCFFTVAGKCLLVFSVQLQPMK